jgi:hypothetical protein
LTDHFADLLARLPAGLDLDRLALETQAIQRKRELAGVAALLRMRSPADPAGYRCARMQLGRPCRGSLTSNPPWTRQSVPAAGFADAGAVGQAQRAAWSAQFRTWCFGREQSFHQGGEELRRLIQPVFDAGVAECRDWRG